MQLSFYYVAAAILLYASLIFCLFNFDCYFENFYCSFLIMAFFLNYDQFLITYFAYCILYHNFMRSCNVYFTSTTEMV